MLLLTATPHKNTEQPSWCNYVAYFKQMRWQMTNSVRGSSGKISVGSRTCSFPLKQPRRSWTPCFCAPITVSMRTTFQNPFCLHQSSPKSDEPTKLINYLGFNGTPLPRKSARAAGRAFPPAGPKLEASTLNGSHSCFKVKSYKGISPFWLTHNHSKQKPRQKMMRKITVAKKPNQTSTKPPHVCWFGTREHKEKKIKGN